MARMSSKRVNHPPSALHTLIEQDLGENLDRWLVRQRKQNLTWDQISRDLAARSKHTVSRESLRTWYQRATANGGQPHSPP